MINYIVYPNSNSKTWIVFVHGAGGSSSIWYRQIKTFHKKYNVLLLDLRGHGNSAGTKDSEYVPYTFELAAFDIIKVLDHLQIEKANFIGVSLGTLVIQQISFTKPKVVQTMILGGAIFKFSFLGYCCIGTANMFKKFIPYMWLYTALAYAVLPKKRHLKARSLFIKEARKMSQIEFVRWFNVVQEVSKLGSRFKRENNMIQTLCISGSEDYMFLSDVKKFIAMNSNHYSNNRHLFVMQNSGHVVNLEYPHIFNKEVIKFIDDQTTKQPKTI